MEELIIDDLNNVNNLEPQGNDDILGLDKPIKLTTRAKIAKVDNDRIFNDQKGLPNLNKNYQKVVRTIRKKDKEFQRVSKPSKSAKYQHEYDNLESVLQFYQIWCHNLFPKARFKDCIQLLRRLGRTSPQLKLYRRELVELELNKIRVEKGIIDDNQLSDDDIYTTAAEVPIVANENEDDEDEEDDWSFMNVRPKHKRSNGLFVDDDEDEMEEDLVLTTEGLCDHLASETGEVSAIGDVDASTGDVSVSTGEVSASTDVGASKVNAPIVTSSTVNDSTTDNNNSTTKYVTVFTEATPQASLAPVRNISEDSDDPFSDNDEIISASFKNTEVPTEEVPNEEDFEDDNDMELMREFD